MTLATAQDTAATLVKWLESDCERIEIAGSIRRERPACNDVDLVIIPKVTEDTDMLGGVISRKNLPWLKLKDYVALPNGVKYGIRFLSGGEQAGALCSVQLRRCQLDVWFTTPEHFASQLLCRTGSMQHNIWLAERARLRGFKWSPGLGLKRGSGLGGEVLTFESEAALYAALGLAFIEPNNREADWIRKHLEFGL